MGHTHHCHSQEVGLRATLHHFLLGICDEPVSSSGDLWYTGLYLLCVWVGVEDQLEPEFVRRQVRGVGPWLARQTVV